MIQVLYTFGLRIYLRKELIMVYWSFWNKIKSFCKKYKVYISVKNVGEDLMTVRIEEPMTKLRWHDTWNYCKEDESEFLARLEQTLKDCRKDVKKFKEDFDMNFNRE